MALILFFGHRSKLENLPFEGKGLISERTDDVLEKLNDNLVTGIDSIHLNETLLLIPEATLLPTFNRLFFIRSRLLAIQATCNLSVITGSSLSSRYQPKQSAFSSVFFSWNTKPQF